MRRGIATFGFLALLASVAIGLGLLAGYVAQRVLAPCCVDEAAPPPLMGMDPLPTVLTAAGAGKPWEIRGLTLSPCDLPTASFTACTFMGDWRGDSFRGVRLWEFDLSRANLDDNMADTGRPFSGESSPVDRRGCTYDAFTRWPAGFDH
jgi:hypothetical protein